MKRILSIAILGIFFHINTAYSFVNDIQSFNKWLYKNGHSQYLEKIESEKCKSFDKGDTNWYYNNCDQTKYKNNLKVKFYKERWGIPYSANPNRDTLIYYHYKNTYAHLRGDKGSKQWGKYAVKASKNYEDFNQDLKKFNYLEKELKKKAILSYIFFEKDKIIIDEMSPSNRFGDFVDNKTKLRSNSVGKTMVSYVAAHAICEGYIDGLDTKINDWPLVKNTLYEDQKLIDLLNMAIGDQKYINEFKDGPSFILNGFEQDTATTRRIMTALQNTKPSKKKYNYNNTITKTIFNYVLFKTGDDFQKVLDKTFKEKAKIKDGIYFTKHKEATPINGNADIMFFATRYDYLRIARSMMYDYQEQNCVGKYLKEVYERRIKKNITRDDEPPFNFSYSYGGQFHFDYPGLKNKVMFAMGGYGGQAILIDMENSRIVVVNSVHYNNSKYKYNPKKLLIDPIKKGIN
jgi:hypothetical protein